MLITPDKKTKSLIIAKNIVAQAKDKFPLCVYLKTQLSPEERELIEKECYITTLSEDNVGYTLYSILWNENLYMPAGAPDIFFAGLFASPAFLMSGFSRRVFVCRACLLP